MLEDKQMSHAHKMQSLGVEGKNIFTNDFLFCLSDVLPTGVLLQVKETSVTLSFPFTSI